MPYGTKDSATTNGNAIKVNYHCHCTLDQIPETVREIASCKLLVDKITYDGDTNMWRVNYFENIYN
jgi:hypothetical protein